MELDLRGTDLQTMRSYLELLGGVAQGLHQIAGDGWRASLTAGVHRWRQWEFPQVTVTLEGETERVAEIARRLRVMATRGGA